MKKRFLPFLVGSLLTFLPVVATPTQRHTLPLTEQEANEKGSLVITHKPIKRVEGFVGESSLVTTLHIKATNITSVVNLELTGADRTNFILEKTTLPLGTWEQDVKVNYKPQKVKSHKATIIIDCPSLPEASTTIAIEGISIDKNNPPTFTVTPQTLETFTCEEKKTITQTINITSQHLAENIQVYPTQKNVFKVSSASIYRNSPGRLVVTFAPLKAGEYKDTIVFHTYGGQDVRIPLVGRATATSQVVEKEGTELVLDTSNPLLVLNETFSNQPKNKPLVLKGWVNNATKGTRAWWGFKTLSYDKTPDEEVAKVTGFDSKVEYGSETPCEMLLVTPALDFKNAASKIFTIRLRGDLLQDNMTDTLRVYYIEKVDNKIEKLPIGGFKIPNTKDESGEWKEYHIDFTDLPLKDVFFIGFGFVGTRGATSSATYFIDDISFGRTDLPVITPSALKFEVTTSLGVQKSFNEIQVTTKNTKEPVKLTLSGRHKSKFKLSATELPKEGGSFSVTFKSNVKGVHFATIKLTSRGAADQYVELVALNGDVTAISDVPTLDLEAVVYDLNGNVVTRTNNNNIDELKAKLQRGIYIVRTKDTTFKVRVN
ncbi:T9SS-dependent choice-of-anchor J family protein [Prevotella sp. oral taxon 299]|uniref:T9SS-dependent choice-of-anchor J family protein n=1 Tax=Prevotella sp. oral taxon 299 TaxID=652716 RepID=UPI0001C3FB42|nr:choice-of-anchor J domain-containing protein [Prevotella sp. oral taxon 299]EFC70248.1 hypothetical protein HMPREF0669_01775 [Prevotella sp. oral taxon 299 str. F0039]